MPPKKKCVELYAEFQNHVCLRLSRYPEESLLYRKTTSLFNILPLFNEIFGHQMYDMLPESVEIAGLVPGDWHWDKPAVEWWSFAKEKNRLASTSTVTRPVSRFAPTTPPETSSLVAVPANHLPPTSSFPVKNIGVPRRAAPAHPLLPLGKAKEKKKKKKNISSPISIAQPEPTPESGSTAPANAKPFKLKKWHRPPMVPRLFCGKKPCSCTHTKYSLRHTWGR